MATSSSSPHIPPGRSSFQMAGGSIPAPRHAPAVKIRSWRRFAASGSEVSVVPAQLLRLPQRRRNALREKAKQPPPPLVVRHQVRPPGRESPESGSLDSQGQVVLWMQPSSNLIREFDVCGDQGASRSGDVASGSKLDDMDVTGDAEEVDEGDIIDESEAAEVEGGGDVVSMSYHARGTDMELESNKRLAPNGSNKRSWFRFAAAERMGSSVLKEEVSVAQRSTPLSRSVIWSGFAALFGICIIFVASKLSRGGSKLRLSRKLFDVHRPEMKEDELDKGNLNVSRNSQEYSAGLLRRRQLDRKELMNNIKKAQDSRKWFVQSNLFNRKDVPTYDDVNIPEMKRNVAEVNTSEEGILETYCTNEKNDIVIPKSIDVIGEERSENYSIQPYVDEVIDSSESNGIGLSKDNKIGEDVDQTVGLTNGAQIMNMSKKDQGNIGDIDVPEPNYSNERVTSTDDKNSTICSFEKEAEVSSVSVPEVTLNSASAPSEFDVKEIEATRNSANIAHTAPCEEFSHNMSKTDTETCKTPVMVETVTATSPQRSREDSADLWKDNAQSMQEVRTSISSGNVKRLTHGTENEHKEETAQHTFAEFSKTEKKQLKNKPRAHLRKKKRNLQTYSDKKAETEQLEQGKPGSETAVNRTACVQKTKQMPKKRQKKVQNEIQRVPALDDVQCNSMVDQINNSQHVKKARRKSLKNAFHNKGAQTSEEIPETAHVINSPDNATTDNIKPFRMADSSVETQLPEDGSIDDQPDGSSSTGTVGKEELKLNI